MFQDSVSRVPFTKRVWQAVGLLEFFSVGPLGDTVMRGRLSRSDHPSVHSGTMATMCPASEQNLLECLYCWQGKCTTRVEGLAI